ncbi:hypothetical protein B9Z55_018303 [Caenorhabditis nigoni]|uniref:Pre-mRNA-splicing factor 38 n=1 Tax=Caenorhabditis nigoni TaxID=1611254 RepID=A0A2G5TDA2_9PELO|nr:hypothetical protein B9Z55_018303 [Caenorhabditis nigoni]
MDTRLTNLYVAAIYKVILCIFGIIGNMLFIHLIYRRKQLQSKTSIFQCIQCFFHIFCSIGTVQNGVIDIGDTYIRSECFNQITYYVFFQAAQGLLMLHIVLDIWFFVKFPIVYRNISKTKSIIFSGIPILIFSIFTTLYGFFTTNDDTIYSCSPPFAFGPKAGVLYKYLFIVLALIIIIIYCIIIRSFKTRNISTTSQISFKKTITRLQLTVLIFFLSWFVSQVLGLIILEISNYPKWLGMLLVHNVFFVCLSYSNTFYVTLLKSKDFYSTSRRRLQGIMWRSSRGGNSNSSTQDQLISMFSSKQSVYIRAIGFIYIRYTQPPEDLWNWLKYLPAAVVTVFATTAKPSRTAKQPTRRRRVAVLCRRAKPSPKVSFSL